MSSLPTFAAQPLQEPPGLPSLVSSPSNAPSQESQKTAIAESIDGIPEAPEESMSLLDEMKATLKEAQELNKKMQE